ncbi:DUF5995 family protein [Polyangium mundeleinium]|uniref:DUF5995 family protein n=1 Tax=Polyangium mundeleinium TaxID=2995306 RepID=A0ABT5ESM4_9BACT|nr:DUF5995 family protein [Polyangium mundeleinium]MDC0744818.1 DUF5995 family protein [Polyangium mundeleinium]
MTNPSIERTINALHAITDRAEREGSRIGYFSALYARVTAAVARGLRAGFFEDEDRMERLDVAFADLYLDAATRYLRREESASLSWGVAFDACAQENLTVLQHIYLGMIAHVLVDLPLGAAQTCPGEAIDGLEGDFYRINDVVRSEMNAFHDDLRRVSPALAGWDTGLWGVMSRGTLFAGRRIAFREARALAMAAPQERASLLTRNDRVATWLGRTVVLGGGARRFFHQVRATECCDVRQVIRALRGQQLEG